MLSHSTSTRPVLPRIGALLAAAIVLAVAPAAAHAGQWRPSLDLPRPADANAGFDAAAGPDGTVVAAWTSDSGFGTDPQVVVSVRPPGGTFSKPRTLSTPGDSPRVAIDGHGTATVVWKEHISSGAETIKQSTRPVGGSFSTPKQLAAFTGEAASLDIATNSRGDTLASWLETRTDVKAPIAVVETVGRPAGAPAFSAPVRVSPIVPSAATDTNVAVGEKGDGMVVWGLGDGRVQASPWFALTNAFGSARTVTSGEPDEPGFHPDVAVTPSGAAVFAYLGDVNGLNPGIKTKTLASSGLSKAGNIFTLSTLAGTPILAADPAGDILAVARTVTVSQSGLGPVRAAFRPAGASSFQTPQFLSANQVQKDPSVALTARGDAVVAWIVRDALGAERVQARTAPRNGAFSALQDDFGSRANIEAVHVFADGEGNVGTLSRRTDAGDPGTLELRPFDGAPPRPTGFTLPTGVVERRQAAFAASFSDTWSPFSVTWRFGDGTTAAGSTPTHTYARAGAFPVAVTARDAVGNVSTRAATVAARALRPNEIDADGDGFTSDKDCNDLDARIHPGALEVKGNAVDENCDRIKEPFAKVTANASLAVLFGHSFTQLKALKVTGLERGDTVKLSCQGRGCRRSLQATIRIKRKTARLTLSKRVAGVRLRKHARVDVRVAHGGLIARIFRFTVTRFGDVPRRTELCQPPAAKRPGRC